MTAPRMVSVGHRAGLIDQELQAANLATILAREQARDAQRAAGRSPASSPPPPPPPKAAATKNSRPAKPTTAAKVPPVTKGKPVTKSEIPSGALVLSTNEVRALDHLLAHPTVSALLGRQRY